MGLSVGQPNPTDPLCMRCDALRPSAHVAGLLLLLGCAVAVVTLFSDAASTSISALHSGAASAQRPLARPGHLSAAAPVPAWHNPHALPRGRGASPTAPRSPSAVSQRVPASQVHRHSLASAWSMPLGLWYGLLLAAVSGGVVLWRRLRKTQPAADHWEMCTVGPFAAGGGTQRAVQTLVKPAVEGVEGVYCSRQSPLARKVLPQVPALSRWSRWYHAPAWLRNGHAHTIFGGVCRRVAAVRYHRTLLPAPDGGTVALDRLLAVDPDAGADQRGGVTFVGPASPDWAAANREKPFLLLTSGLGGGSQDTHVRSMAAAAAARGWQVGIVNMRGCGGSPVTSPRFFSAHRGSTDDVRLAIACVREAFIAPGVRVAVLGWSNGGTIVNNLLAEQATEHPDAIHAVDAGVCLAAPLDMPAAARHFKRPFQRHVYDRKISGGLVDNFRAARGLFDGEVATWDGGTCTIDATAVLRCTTLEAIDEEITRKVFGFPDVAAYYRDASSDQRLPDVRVPLLLVSALDDPIAPGHCIPWTAPSRNEHLLMAVTAQGGHLGWCDHASPFGRIDWVEDASLSFLEAALDL